MEAFARATEPILVEVARRSASDQPPVIPLSGGLCTTAPASEIGSSLVTAGSSSAAPAPVPSLRSVAVQTMTPSPSALQQQSQHQRVGLGPNANQATASVSAAMAAAAIAAEEVRMALCNG